jgi:hypothetical protein
MRSIGILCALLMCAAPVAAQSTVPVAAQHAASDAKSAAGPSSLVDTGLLVLTRADASEQQAGAQGLQVTFQPVRPPQSAPRFQWNDAIKQYMTMLMFQHSVRLFQEKTHSELGGPFWSDYVESVGGLGGWGDGDSLVTNYVCHPMMGSISGYIQVQNDPAGRRAEFGRSGAYWRSRGAALAAAAVYSAQFELGPMSEASIGNVGLKPGTMAWVDLLVTPLAGVGMMVAEDAIDRFVIAKAEGRLSRNQTRLLRTFLNPSRSLANVIRFQVPWTRDTRGLVSKASLPVERLGVAGRDGAGATR